MGRIFKKSFNNIMKLYNGNIYKNIIKYYHNVSMKIGSDQQDMKILVLVEKRTQKLSSEASIDKQTNGLGNYMNYL